MAPPAKRRKLHQVEEITFDPAARQEYLTGFHKRKQQRIQNARDVAAKREKEERVKERRQIREQRQDDLAQHVAEVDAELRKQNTLLGDDESSGSVDGETEEWDGIPDDVGGNEEYVDEEKYTTVTVEAMDLQNGASEEDEAESRAEPEPRDTSTQLAKKKRPWSKDGSQAKSKKKKFRYESKAERQMSRQKQKIKNRAAKARRKDK